MNHQRSSGMTSINTNKQPSQILCPSYFKVQFTFMSLHVSLRPVICLVVDPMLRRTQSRTALQMDQNVRTTRSSIPQITIFICKLHAISKSHVKLAQQLPGLVSIKASASSHLHLQTFLIPVCPSPVFIYSMSLWKKCITTFVF